MATASAKAMERPPDEPGRGSTVSGSITRRLLGGSALVAIAFLGLAGLSLDQAYRDSTEQAQRAQLQAHIHTLLAAADEDAQGRPRLPAVLAAPGFNRPDSGLYAQMSGEQGQYTWRSASLLARDYAHDEGLATGQSRLVEQDGLVILQQGIGWDDLSGNSLPYVFSVALDTAPLRQQQAAFRTTLWSWLGGSGLVLLLLQLGLARWGLQPLHRIANEVRRIEQGRQTRIDTPPPRELRPLTDNLNSLIQQGQARQERLRHVLADLAHSLKTPLAVLRGIGAGQPDKNLSAQIDEQTGRIDQIVGYQRQRLALAGSGRLLAPVPLNPILVRLCTGLEKVHRERALHCELALADGLQVRADQGDLFELFGNLLENAFKYTHSQVRVSTQGDTIVIEDDGSGIDPAQLERLLQRGERADQRQPGEGIGLAVVQEIVRQYDGELRFEKSPLGGAAVKCRLGAA